MRGTATAMIVGCLTAACATYGSQATENAVTSHPLVGCWDSADEQSREGWTIDPSGWLIGYSADRNEDGAVVFFEFLRIERGGSEEVLVVVGQSGDMVRFGRVPHPDPMTFRFENPEHDYPQVITYVRRDDRLDAEIAYLDGTETRQFLKSACRN